jgi:fermentation-respiration switch protein FrsA (DUF1100 family)
MCRSLKTHRLHFCERRVLAPNLPSGLLITSRFDNLSKISAVRCPIFLAHGTLDPLVPPEMQSRLARAAKSPATLVRVDGAAHNDIFMVGGDSLYRQLKTFVNDLPAARARDPNRNALILKVLARRVSMGRWRNCHSDAPTQGACLKENASGIL